MTPKDSAEVKELIECVRICDFNLERGIFDQVEQATMRDTHIARINELLTTEGQVFRIQCTKRDRFIVLCLFVLCAGIIIGFGFNVLVTP